MTPSRQTDTAAPATSVAAFSDTLPLGADPLAVLRSLPSRQGTVLLESHDAEHGSARRSILVTRAPLAVDIRGGQVRVRVFEASAAPLLDRLAAGLAGSRREGIELVADYPTAPGSAAQSDRKRLTAPCVLDALRVIAGLVADATPGPRLAPGLFGTFSYELVERFEQLPERKPDPLEEPDARFVLATDVIVFDHQEGDVQIVTRGLPWEQHTDARSRHARTLELVESAPPTTPLPQCDALATAESDVPREHFEQHTRFLLERILDGDIFQAVLSRGLRIPSKARSLDVYQALRQTNPSPYMFHIDLEDGALLGASPETFLRVEDGVLELRPIAGTVPRGFTAEGTIDHELDGRLALSLQLDPKEQAEHAMLLDLARNDVARVATPGTTRVVQQFTIEKYSHVQHLVSRVQGELAEGLDALHAYRAAANAGTLTGAPKVRAMELIRECEPTARGFYGGACGYLLQDGSFDSCIVIRSLRHKDGIYHARAGAGVVALSVPEREFLETEHKARSCRAAIAMAEGAA